MIFDKTDTLMGMKMILLANTKGGSLDIDKSIEDIYRIFILPRDEHLKTRDYYLELLQGNLKIKE